MYIPNNFAVTDEDEIYEFVNANSFGQLVSSVDRRLFSSHIPFHLLGCRKRIRCHLAKQNPQVVGLEGQEVLITLQGAHDYISPSWYETPGVPTWNYQAVHIYGRCRLISDADELAGLLSTLTNKYESEFAEPWKADYSESLLGAIVGIEIEITDIQCKYKLSQNRSRQDQLNVIKQLYALDSNDLALAMQKNQG